MATLFVSIAVRSLMLLLLTLVIATVCRRRSAAVVHGIWAVGLSGCLVIPLVSLLTPGWSLPVFPPRVPPVSFMRHDVLSGLPTQRFAEVATPEPVGPRDKVSDAQDLFEPAQSIKTLAMEDAVPANLQTSPSGSTGWFDWPSLATVALVFWLTGTVIALLRLLQQILSTQSLARRADVVTDKEWLDFRDLAARKLGLRSGVPLKSHTEALSPMLAGVLQPTVLLPRDADKWSPERRQLVLLHELAHIGRQDVLTQMMAALACAVYWFNPLTWWGANQMKRLREIACDDVVVTHTSVPANYAQMLLEVAREYRSRQLISAVAMARSSRVEERITAILDAARSRAVLTRRSVGAFTVVALMGAVGVGTCQLSSWAEEGKVDRSTAAAAESPIPLAGETGTLTLVALDDNDQPVPECNVKIRVRQVFMGSDTWTHQQTDKAGRTVIKLPQTTPHYFSASVEKSEYAPFLAEWEQRDGSDPIPAEYTVLLDPGRTIGGIVQDADGRPIEGVTVNPFYNVKMRAERTYQMGAGAQAKTDSTGQWTYASLPADLQNVQLTFAHPDFVELRATEPVSELAIPAEGKPHLVTVLQHGIRIGGRVTNADGKPIAAATARFYQHGRFSSDSPTATTDAAGRFQFACGEAGDALVTISAPDYAPALQTVQVAENKDPIDVQLTSGSPLRVRVVGPDQKPLEGAYVSLWNWDEQGVYGSIPASRGKTDASGQWQWDHVPEGSLQFAISLLGYRYISGVALTRGEDNVILMSQQPVMPLQGHLLWISGRVFDTETGAGIPRFRVTAGYQREKGERTIWLQDTKSKGRDGNYRRGFSSNDLGSETYALVLRFEADGYEPGTLEQVIGDGHDFRVDIALQRAGDADLFNVVTPHGQAAAGASVAVCTPQVGPIVQDGVVISNSTCERTTTDVGGRFSIAPQKGPFALLVVHDFGAAYVTEEQLAKSHTVSLEPWSRVEGTVMIRGRPAADETITLNRNDLWTAETPKIFYQYQTKTDQNGKFCFERVMSGSGQVARVAVSNLSDGMRSLTPTLVVDANFFPGQNTQIDLSRAGRQASNP